MERMTKRERIQAALRGGPLDRMPVAFWRHWPGDDQQPETLAAAALDFQFRYDLDFIKLPVSSTYTVDDYGVKHEYQGSLMGDRAYLERVIHSLDDWDRIQPLDVRQGTYGRNLQATGLVLKQKDKDTPLIVTMFNPLSLAAYLAGDALLLAHLRSRPEKVMPALEALTETSVRFARAAVEMGADGVFLSTRLASLEMMAPQEYRQYGRPGDLAVLRAAQGSWFNVLHFHGQFPILPELADYPVQTLNWHDRTTAYSLSAAAGLFAGALMGGVEQYTTLHFGSRAQISAQVEDAVRQMNGRRLIVAPGCTYPLDVPHGNLMALRRAMETNNP
jgi:uroporphyrinogen decarboxylase